MPKEDKNTKIEVDIAGEAISLVLGEKETWQDAVVFITENIAFKVRDLIRTLRKNYWGIFDTPSDPITGKAKTWIPLSEIVADNYVNNTDLDASNMDVTAKKFSAMGLVPLVRAVVKSWMDENIFGECLDETERSISIDGSAVWKTFEGYDKKGKKTMIRKDVDLLNLYFDPSAKNLQEAYRVTERALLSLSEIESMDGWINTKRLKASYNLHPTSTSLTGISNFGRSGTKARDVWETWGLIPKYLITGKKKDTEEVEGHIVVSGLEGEKGNRAVHLIETNLGYRPYEEGHAKKIRGRWLGRSPVEVVIGLQVWINMVVNIRKTKNIVSQLGLFKIKRGSGVTPSMIRNLAANGAVLVNNMEDIEQWTMQDASQGSYADESQIMNWAEKLTASFPVATGEPQPASTKATDLVIKSRAVNKNFKIYRDQIGYFLRRWMKRHAFPILAKTKLHKGELAEIRGNFEELKEIDGRIVNFLLYKKIEELNKKQVLITPEQVLMARQESLKKLAKMGTARYFNIMKQIDLSQYDVMFTFTNQEVDKQVLVDKLISALQLAPEYQDVLIRKIFDTLGLDTYELEQGIKKSREVAGEVPLAARGQQRPSGEMPRNTVAAHSLANAG